MNITTSTVTGRHENPTVFEHHVVRRVSALDRLALHIGIALIKWGRRPRAVESRERRASRVEHELARLERERAAERSLRLIVPLR
jgi:hypothetical protein